jgi:hypothetical protein
MVPERDYDLNIGKFAGCHYKRALCQVSMQMHQQEKAKSAKLPFFCHSFIVWTPGSRLSLKHTPYNSPGDNGRISRGEVLSPL